MMFCCQFDVIVLPHKSQYSSIYTSLHILKRDKIGPTKIPTDTYNDPSCLCGHVFAIQRGLGGSSFFDDENRLKHLDTSPS